MRRWVADCPYWLGRGGGIYDRRSRAHTIGIPAPFASRVFPATLGLYNILTDHAQPVLQFGYR